MYKKDCIVVNIIGGPGVGKSILTSDVFSGLKRKFISAEISPEYIKKKIREKSLKAVQSQIYIFGKQQYQQFTLREDVDVIITDSPFILCSIYDTTKCPLLKSLIIQEFNRYENMNFYIKRDDKVPYEQEGRYQDADGAKKVDTRVLDFLEDNFIPYTVVNGIGDDTLEFIIDAVINKLNGRK